MMLRVFYRWSDRVKVRWVRRWLSRGVWLDVGCGAGRFLKGLDPSQWEKVGVEPHLQGGAALGEVSVTLHRQMLEECRFASKSFDVVSLWHVLEHLPNPKGVLVEVARILKDGGVMVCSVPHTASLGFRWFQKHWFHCDAPRHAVHYRRSTLDRLLRECGLKPCAWHAQTFEFPLDLWHSATNRWPMCRFPLVSLFGIPLTLAGKMVEKLLDRTETIAVVTKKS